MKLPAHHRSRSHSQLVSQMTEAAAKAFAHKALPWDPTRELVGADSDQGRAALDCYALAAHVLWTYQEAWGREAFLPTAARPLSRTLLLGQIGYRATPAIAAIGLQHLQCKAGTSGTLPRGFRVQSQPGDAGQPPQLFETLRATHISARLNALVPFLPGDAATKSTAGAITAVRNTGGAAGSGDDADSTSETPVVGALGAEPSGAQLVNTLESRLEAGRAGTLAQRKAARARQKALRLADLMSDLKAQEVDTCGDMLASVCQELCEAHAQAEALVDDVAPGPLSESQELLLGLLTRLGRLSPDALMALEQALRRCDDEDLDAWARRLDQLLVFLDALLVGVIQESREQVVLLHGPQALSRLEAKLLPDAAHERYRNLGVAPPGTDALYILPQQVDTEGAPQTVTELIAPGDWLVLAEEVEHVLPNGDVTRERRDREAVRVVRVREDTPSTDAETMTRITFEPPLRRRYDLNRTVVVGNVAEVSHGKTIDQITELSAGESSFELAERPLCWLPDALAPDGRRPEVELWVQDRKWERVDDLRWASTDAPVYALEPTTDGGARIRFATSISHQGQAALSPVRIRYRVGAGALGNQLAGTVTSLVSAHPAVAETSNPLDFGGGADAQSLDLAMRKAKAGIHALDRAISLSDAESLALSHPGVHRARVTRDVAGGREHVRVVLAGANGRAFNAEELSAVRSFLVARMPSLMRVSVVNRTLVPIRVEVLLRVSERGQPLDIILGAREALGAPSGTAVAERGLLAPGNVELGQDVLISDVYRALEGIEGLDSVFVERLYRADSASSRSHRIEVAVDEFPIFAAREPGVEAVNIRWERAYDR